MIHDDLSCLIDWFKMCHKHFGKENAIRLGTIDNPGWYFTVDLENTNLANKQMKEVAHDFSKYDWLVCWIKDKRFEARGGVSNLETMLSTFKLWLLDLDYKKTQIFPKNQFDTDDDLVWLINWFHSHCNNDWEHGYGIEITTTRELSWIVRIELTDTDLSKKEFKNTARRISSNNWISCCVRDEQFEGLGSLENLYEIFSIFRSWAKIYNPFHALT